MMMSVQERYYRMNAVHIVWSAGNYSGQFLTGSSSESSSEDHCGQLKDCPFMWVSPGFVLI